MSSTGHPHSELDLFIRNELSGLDGLQLVSCDDKESIVLEEKEITWVYVLAEENAPVKVVITVSDPIYFCNASFVVNEDKHFSLKSYLTNELNNNELEELFEKTLEEEITDEEYTMAYLKVLKKYLSTESVQNVLKGDSWPNIPSE